MPKNIVVTGVVGQGVHFLSRILGEIALNSSLDVKISDANETSAEGGATAVFVRIGEADEIVNSPIIGKGYTDVILSLELIETARYLPYLSNGGTIITSTQQIMPKSVENGEAEYPDEIISDIQFLGVDLRPYDLQDIAEKAGDISACTAVLLGLATDSLGFDYDIVRRSVLTCVSEDNAEVYLSAFDIGYNISRKA